MMLINNHPSSDSHIAEEQLEFSLWQAIPDSRMAWLKSALDTISACSNIDEAINYFLRFSAMTRRTLGTAFVTSINQQSWHIDEASRLILLIKTLNTAPENKRSEVLSNVYRQSDETEKQVIAKGLTIIDDGESVNLALAIGRTNNIELFSALALSNPYPARYYNDREFNQLILKALFMELDLRKTVGLQTRLNPSLSLLSLDLLKERLAADRSPPATLSEAINLEDLSPTDQSLVNESVISTP
ncbi:MAG: EboA domain-containing protein [Endozoicomonas sp.]